MYDLNQTDAEISIGTDKDRKFKIVWRNVLSILYMHITGIMGILYIFYNFKLINVSVFVVLVILCSLGAAVGSHKLWSHNSFKATKPLEILLMLLQTMGFQNHVYEWVRDHRLHHKYADTDADPHNASRGFFYSHVGWLLVTKHELVKSKGKIFDLSDLENNPILMFQKKHYGILMPLLAFVLPTFCFCYICNETFSNAWSMTLGVWVLQVNMTWSINSFSHLVGTKPYDIKIKSTDSTLVNYITFCEGNHNYHHTFPQDYKAPDIPYMLSASTAFLHIMKALGLASDFKTYTPDIVLKRALRTGDVSQIANKDIKDLLNKSI